MTTTLIACSHGTHSDAGRRAISALVAQVRELLPDIPVAEAFVDVQQPYVAEVVTDAVAHGDAVVVPLLLSTGFHTKVDIARAVAAFPGRAVAAPALGPHPLVTAVVADRLGGMVGPGDAVVLAAAGSSDPAAAGDVADTAAELSALIGFPVTVGFAAGAGPRIEEAVAAARAGGAARVIAASYVLAPGHFANVVAGAGADAATEPLAPDIRVAELVVERFRSASSLARSAPPGR